MTLLSPREVAEIFGVDPKTVTRWAKTGKLASIRTLGGHRRFRSEHVQELLTRRTEGKVGHAKCTGSQDGSSGVG